MVGLIAVALVIALNACPGCFGQAGTTLTPSPTGVAVGTSPPISTPASTPSTLGSPPSSTISPSGTPGSTETGGPAQTVPPEIAAQIEAVIAQMPAIRELEPLRDVPYQMVTRDEFRRVLEEELDEHTDIDHLRAQQRLLIRLGLLPADTDLLALIVELNSGAVAAYYRPETGTFYVIETGRPFGPAERMFTAHEYTHALQDQHFDLADRIADPTEGDAALAELAVIEGDASTAMLAWAQQNLSFEELLEVLSGSLSNTDQQVLDDMPAILSRELLFPYNEGMTFATGLQQSGGWAAVNQALQDPPPSTEQILHPEKYTANEDPAAVAMPDAAQNLGDGWTQVLQQTLGELDTQVIVAGGESPPQTIPGLPGGEWPHAEAAAGWNGDRIYMWEGPDGDWAVGWITAWDTASDADEFAARVDQLKPTLAGPAMVSNLKPDVVQVLIASDDQTLLALGAAVGE